MSEQDLEIITNKWSISKTKKFLQPEISFKSGQPKIVVRCVKCKYECVVCPILANYQQLKMIKSYFNNLHKRCEAKVPPWKSLHPDIEQPNPEAEDDGSGAEAAAAPAPTAPVPIVNPNLAPPVLWFSRQMNRLAGDGRASPILPDSQRYRSSQCAREPESPSASPVEKQQYLRCHYKSYTIKLYKLHYHIQLKFLPSSAGSVFTSNLVNPNLAPPVLWFSRQMNRLAGDGRASPILPDSQRYRSSQCAREPESPSASPVEKQQYLRKK
ncbi:hypothetical protein DAPPUDRAFT_334671 [Daphnia pulex]|uniref:Uncharacterized protein n=1 Tax=Daphnia pulex TaxID=6669 RepID=E9HW59_DAPPU|nr:hypothetical protein DAPPUDRAFT_334671 [Daphnia pulex]|eukprot:EFX64025.1 hypothetical protein DAPPUDRAFT_334671 [Daphnia pulex]